jgi:hypothetical protein
MWRCKACGIIVSDVNRNCPSCAHEDLTVKPDALPDKAEQKGVGESRDSEGYTLAERVARRPLKEIADNHLLAMQRARRRAIRARARKGGREMPMPGAVVPGSIRISRPVFSPFKH